MEILFFTLLAVGLGFGFLFLFYNRKIVFELDDRYYNLKDLREAAIKHLQKEGKTCEATDNGMLLVNGKKYLLTERSLNCGGVPVQQVVLKELRRG